MGHNDRTLAELLASIVVVDPVWDCLITGIALDSRQVEPGDLFIAYPGNAQDGRQFIAQAIDQGARAIIAEEKSFPSNITLPDTIPCFMTSRLMQHISKIAARFYGNPSRALTIVGVTGTNGKTSCSQFISACLQQKDQPCGVIGTLGSGYVDNLAAGNLTTPDAISMQRQLAGFLQQEVRHVVMEVSSHALIQGRVKNVEFDLAVFTNLSRDHLDYHGSMRAYGAAKQQLFKQFGLCYAVINIDDSFGQTIVNELPSTVQCITYGLRSSRSDLRVTHMECGQTGTSAHISTPWGNTVLRSQLLGSFNLENLLATLAVLNLLDVPFEESVVRVEQLTGAVGRMQAIRQPGKPLVIIDYAHTPEALRHVLQTLQEIAHGRLWCVFGCGGDRDKGKRPLMGHIADQLAHQVILTNDNPRTEDPQQIVKDILPGIASMTKVTIEYDRAVAIQQAIQQAGSDDVVLVAGKGHEMYQQIGEQRLPFNDLDWVHKGLESK